MCFRLFGVCLWYLWDICDINRIFFHKKNLRGERLSSSFDLHLISLLSKRNNKLSHLWFFSPPGINPINPSLFSHSHICGRSKQINLLAYFSLNTLSHLSPSAILPPTGTYVSSLHQAHEHTHSSLIDRRLLWHPVGHVIRIGYQPTR